MLTCSARMDAVGETDMACIRCIGRQNASLHVDNGSH